MVLVWDLEVVDHVVEVQQVEVVFLEVDLLVVEAEVEVEEDQPLVLLEVVDLGVADLLVVVGRYKVEVVQLVVVLLGPVYLVEVMTDYFLNCEKHNLYLTLGDYPHLHLHLVLEVCC